MNPAAAAPPWRIGCVQYLNARPLIYGLKEQVTLCTPARLADLMYRGQFEVGLVPVAEVLRHDIYDIVDGIAIGSRGPAKSVFLAHRRPPRELRRVAVDSASRTSAWLLQVILKEVYGVEPEFYPRPVGAKLSEHEAMLLIGDEALWYATRPGAPPVLDLGEAWQHWTGLPFVFAVWALPRGAAAGPLAALLRTAKANGLAHLEEIVEDASEATAEFRREYLSRWICYSLGAEEKRGLRRFQETAHACHLIPQCHELRFVN